MQPADLPYDPSDAGEAPLRAFPGRVALQQRVLPAYRAEFFERLAAACAGGLSMLAGRPRPAEMIASASQLRVASYQRAHNLHLARVDSPYYFLWQAGLADWLRRWDPDVLVVEANPRYLSTPGAMRWMHTRGRPVIGWGLGAPPITGGGPAAGLQRSLRRRFLARCDALVAYSRRGAAEYRAQGFPEDRVYVAPNAVSGRPTVFPPERPSRLERPARVLFVGRLQARKRLENLLQACAELPPALRPEVWIAGDGPARTDLEQLAGQVYPQTRFFGARYGTDLDQLFREADLFVLPGTGGLAVQQAIGHGLPAVVARGDGTQDDLVRPENGWQVSPDDVAALRAALQEALSDLPRLRQMGRESYRIASQEHNLDTMLAVFLKALNEVKKR